MSMIEYIHPIETLHPGLYEIKIVLWLPFSQYISKYVM